MGGVEATDTVSDFPGVTHLVSGLPVSDVRRVWGDVNTSTHSHEGLLDELWQEGDPCVRFHYLFSTMVAQQAPE